MLSAKLVNNNLLLSDQLNRVKKIKHSRTRSKSTFVLKFIFASSYDQRSKHIEPSRVTVLGLRFFTQSELFLKFLVSPEIGINC